MKNKRPSETPRADKSPENAGDLGYSPNKEWFKTQSKRAGISQRALAKFVGLDPSAMNRSLRGARKFQLHEAAQMARALGVPISEVVSNIGFEDAVKSVPIIGRITGDNSVEFVDGLGEAVLPPDATLRIKAYEFDTLSSQIAHYDGYIAYVEPHDGVDAEVIGRLAVITTAERNRPVFGMIVRGSRKGNYHVKLVGQGVTFEANTIKAVELIVWMRAP